LLAVLTRRNAILVLVGIELMLNAANINFIAFWASTPAAHNAAEPAAQADVRDVLHRHRRRRSRRGLAIILMVFRHTRSTDLNKLDSLHG
jgi:NADH:ubiquinone oxidoreductase subunit K